MDTASAVRQAVEEFGYERTLRVLAVAIRHYSHDGRISRDNIRWAERFPLKPDTTSSGFGGDRNIDFLILKTHLVALDAFTKAARRDYERSRPLSEEDIVGEAERIFKELKKPEGPNGLDGKSFTAQFSPEFVTRANAGDYVMLSSMMPFRSFEVTPMREFIPAACSPESPETKAGDRGGVSNSRFSNRAGLPRRKRNFRRGER